MKSARVAGHLGELLQGRLGDEGPIALITLPAPALFIEAQRSPGPFVFDQGNGVALTRPVLRGLFHRLGQPLAGHWRLKLRMPIGQGAGASTAAILAVAQVLAPELARAELEALCLSLEGASDPLLDPAPERLLWASREGRALRQMAALPPLQVIGGFSGPAIVTDPTDRHFINIAPYLASWDQACGDAAALGALITEASLANMALRGRDSREILALTKGFGALGFCHAHTGSAFAFLLRPDQDGGAILAHLAALGWQHLQQIHLGSGI